MWGPGGYTLSSTELVLLGIRGSMPPLKRGLKSAIFYPRGRHSEKPPIVSDHIVSIFGDLPRIELFARDSVAGWDRWGNETECEIGDHFRRVRGAEGQGKLEMEVDR
jgi:site-specific DNA-methyltransferase (adenine-specific)